MKNGRGKDSAKREESLEETVERMRRRAKERGLDVKIEAHPMADELDGTTVFFIGGRRGGASGGSGAFDKGKDY